jgi:hypothetical protein
MIAKISDLAAELLMTAWYADDMPYQEAQANAREWIQQALQGEEFVLNGLFLVRKPDGLYLAGWPAQPQDAWLAEYTKALA